jgi:hypothetical protein
MTFQKGHNHSEKTIEKLSLARKGKTWEQIFGIEKAKEMRKNKIKLMKERNPNNMVGVREKLSKSKREENNPNWKGDEVGYSSLHEWIKSRKPKPQFCERCNKKPSYDLANKSGKYKRDINDFEWLCRSCHMETDGRLTKLNINRRAKNERI